LPDAAIPIVERWVKRAGHGTSARLVLPALVRAGKTAVASLEAALGRLAMSELSMDLWALIEQRAGA